MIWEYRWAAETGAHGMAAREELVYLGYEKPNRVDPPYGSRLFRRSLGTRREDGT